MGWTGWSEVEDRDFSNRNMIRSDGKEGKRRGFIIAAWVRIVFPGLALGAMGRAQGISHRQ